MALESKLYWTESGVLGIIFLLTKCPLAMTQTVGHIVPTIYTQDTATSSNLNMILRPNYYDCFNALDRFVTMQMMLFFFFGGGGKLQPKSLEVSPI